LVVTGKTNTRPTFSEDEVAVPLLNVTPPIEFEVVDVVVMFPVTARVDPLNVKLELATAALEDVELAVVRT
jgi:hypothetical protein